MKKPTKRRKARKQPTRLAKPRRQARQRQAAKVAAKRAWLPHVGSIRTAKERSKRMALKSLVGDYHAMWDDPRGRRVLSDIMLHGNVISQMGSGSDPISLALDEGMRRNALRIPEMLSLSAADFPRLAKHLSDSSFELAGIDGLLD